MKTMKRLAFLLLVITTMTACQHEQKIVITRSDIQLQSDTLTPEALWAMGRIGSYSASPDGKHVAYQVTYYSVPENRSNTILYVQNISGKSINPTFLGPGSDPVWLDNNKIAYANKGDIWTMTGKGKSRKQLTNTNGAVEGFLFSPDLKKVIIIKSVPYHDIIHKRPADLPLSQGRVITDVMYRHWDHYVESIPHPFVLDLETGKEFDILEGQPYECPMEPFGGIEQLAWSPDSKQIAYTCRKKTGLAYSISTDSDIYLYDIETGEEQNLCKTLDYVAPDVEPTHTLKDQTVNAKGTGMTTEQAIADDGGFYVEQQVGYDMNPKFSPDGRYVAWLSMERDGYEADRQRLCVYFLGQGTKQYITESFDSNVDDFVWADDNNTIYYIGVWHATVNLYRTNLQGEVTQLTDEQADWGALQMVNGKSNCLLMERHDFFHPADL